MKHGPVTKHEKRNTSKKFDDDVMSANCDVILFSQFIANLKQSRKQIPNAWYIKLTFSLKIIFYLTKTENRTKKSLTQLSYYCFHTITNAD